MSDAEIFADLFAGKRQRDAALTRSLCGIPEPEPQGDDVETAARKVLDNPDLTRQFVKGDTDEERMADAANLARALGWVSERPPEPPPDFDGGAREPFIETDPVADHNQLLGELLGNTPSGGGGQW